jgi:hypothetical protein
VTSMPTSHSNPKIDAIWIANCEKQTRYSNKDNGNPLFIKQFNYLARHLQSTSSRAQANEHRIQHSQLQILESKQSKESPYENK